MKREKPDRRLFDANGTEVHLVMKCTKCCEPLPFDAFGFRKTPDGKLRNISQCSKCRGEVAARPDPVVNREGEKARVHLRKVRELLKAGDQVMAITALFELEACLGRIVRRTNENEEPRSADEGKQPEV